MRIIYCFQSIKRVATVLLFLVFTKQVFGQQSKDSLDLKKDTSTTAVKKLTVVNSSVFDSPVDSLIMTGYDPVYLTNRFSRSHLLSVNMDLVTSRNDLSIPQYVKGNLPGVYVQEPSGEPGTMANIFVHGIGAPLTSKRELYDQQAVVYVDGVPQIKQNPFIYDIQKYDFNPIGTATDVLAQLSQNNIESIEVINDPVRLATLGPLAANGAIWVKTKNAEGKNLSIEVNANGGFATKPRVDVINAAYENMFRRRFYDAYGNARRNQTYPSFLRDSTNSDYYGQSDWTDLYYKTAAVYTADASITFGSDRSLFRFFGSGTRNANSADETALRRYTAGLYINVAPYKWLSFTSKLDYAHMIRNRNRSITDRLAEVRYIPDLTNPLTPSKNLYGAYLDQFSKVIDNNVNSVLNGYLGMKFSYDKFILESRIALNYGEEYRDAFWPTTLLEGNNFVSNYFAVTQRLNISNNLSYYFDLPNKNKLTFYVGQNYYLDDYRYNYAYAYNGPNDFTKINVVEGNSSYVDYLQSQGFVAYYFPSSMRTKLLSFNGNVVWDIDDYAKVNLLVRRDASTTLGIDHRWFNSYGISTTVNLLKSFDMKGGALSTFNFKGGWSRIGKPFSDDRYQAGPQYRVDLGWGNEPTIGSYNGLAGLSRPYSTGWINYGIPWQYNQNLQAGLEFGLNQDKIKVLASFYSRDDKNGLIALPVASEYGYTSSYQSGLVVNNKGLDLSVDAVVLEETPNKLGWIVNANANYNVNKLKALPGGISEVVIGSNKFVVGKPIDQFWVLENEGKYSSIADVPSSNGIPLNYNGIAFSAGDAIWKDQNNDNVINDQDKILKGNILPKVTGGFGSVLTYNAFSLNFQFYFALGRKVLNRYASKRLDFINTENANDINSVKEITYWEKSMDLINYPIYNPWSDVIPYREDQDLFLDNASFAKLRSLSFAVDFSKINGASNPLLKRATVYVSGTNLWTITKFKGSDPELATYNGIYTGNAIRMPKMVILGVKFKLGL